MKRGLKRDELPAPGRVTCELHRRFDCFRAGVSEEAAPGLSIRDQRLELARELRHLFVIKIGARHVNELRGLFLNRAHDIGMTVSGRAHGDTRAEIEKSISIDVLDNRAAGALRDERIGTGIRRRDVFAVAVDDRASFGPRQFRNESRKLLVDYLRRHLVPSRVSSMTTPRLSNSCLI